MANLVGKWLGAAAIGGFGLLSAAHADVITFEAVTPDTGFYVDTESFEDGAYTLTVAGDFAVVDTVASIPVSDSLLGNDSKFFQNYNDSRVSIARTDGQAFTLAGFDAGFITPYPVGSDVYAGRVFAFGTTSGGATVFGSWEFAASDANGAFSFLTYSGTPDFAAFTSLTSLQFGSCIYTDTDCVSPADNLGQFALDNVEVNVSVAVVPEPSTYALMALGLAGLAWRARRARR